MPQVIKQNHVVSVPEVITKEGEVKIKLEITLNINTTATTTAVEVAAVASPVVSQEEKVDVNWAIPSFKTDNKIKFGKRVES